MSQPLGSLTCSPSYGQPAWLAYNDADHSMWVASPPDCVSVLAPNASWYAPTATYTVGDGPFGVAVDPTRDLVYVTNTGSDNVTVLDGSTGASVANVPVGQSPTGIAYDANVDEVFVADSASSNVSVISGSTRAIVGAVAVGLGPVGIVADPASGQVFVADNGSNQISVISESLLVVTASVPTGSIPYGLALDNLTDRVYVTNRGSSNITVIDASTDLRVTDIPVTVASADLEGISFDPGRHLMWAGAGSWIAIAVSTTALEFVGWMGTDPSGSAFDPYLNATCMTNTGNVTLECYYTTGYPVQDLKFVPLGLPSGASWSVTINGGENSTIQAEGPITFQLASYLAWLAWDFWVTPPAGYSASPSSGSVVLNGSTTEVDVAISSGADDYPVNITESGLPPGTVWGVTLSGTNFTSTHPTILFALPNGTYPYSPNAVTGYTSPPSGTLTINGAGVFVVLEYGTNSGPPTNYSVEFVAYGLPSGTPWGINTLGGNFTTTSATLTVLAAPGNHTYSVFTPSWFVPEVPASSFTVSHSSLTIAVQFVTLFELQFVASGLPDLVNWSVSLGDGTQTTSGTRLVFGLLEGSYPFLVLAPTGFTATPSNGTIAVTSNVSVSIAFAPSTGMPPPPVFPVTFSELGLAHGSDWFVLVDGVAHASTNSTINLALANGSYDYSTATSSAYQPSPRNGTFVVAGEPVGIAISFGPFSSSGTTTTSTALPDSAIVLGAAAGGLVGGVVAGAAVAWMSSRRSRKPPSDPAPAASTDE